MVDMVEIITQLVEAVSLHTNVQGGGWGATPVAKQHGSLFSSPIMVDGNLAM